MAEAIGEFANAGWFLPARFTPTMKDERG